MQISYELLICKCFITLGGGGVQPYDLVFVADVLVVAIVVAAAAVAVVVVRGCSGGGSGSGGDVISTHTA